MKFNFAARPLAEFLNREGENWKRHRGEKGGEEGEGRGGRKKENIPLKQLPILHTGHYTASQMVYGII